MMPWIQVIPEDDASKPSELDNYVAWCRYVTSGERPTRIVLCDSDAPGAFRVYHERDLAAAKDDLAAYKDGTYLLHKALDAANAERDALKADAERWQYWKPWLERRVGDLSKYKADVDAARANDEEGK